MISKEEIDAALALRRPGQSRYTSPRRESDEVEIFSGLFEGKTTGAPIALLIRNQDADSKSYTAVQGLLKPGHANYSYLQKYGIFDHRGGGRASARETAARVAGGAVAKKWLALMGIEVNAWLSEVGEVTAHVDEVKREEILASPLFCPDPQAAVAMMERIDAAKDEGDSVGGVVQAVATGVPAGLGDPIYGKLGALLASAMLSLPACRGFEIGEGFKAAKQCGSEHNDLYELKEGKTVLASNHAGGILAGISTGEPIVIRVPFKPPSSIRKAQSTVSILGEPAQFRLPEGSRHDPCIAIRAVPVVEAMMALVLADAILMNRCAKV